MKPTRRQARLSTIVTLTLLVSLAVRSERPAYADTRTYPGTAPCDTTLQACIDGTASGDTIEITTSSPIDEDISVNKILTLTSASGVAAVIGGGATPRKLSIHDSGPGGGSVAITLDHLQLDHAWVDVQFVNGSGHSLTLTDSRISSKIADQSAYGIHVYSTVPNTILIRNNVVDSAGQAMFLDSNLTSGSASFTVLGNYVTASDPHDSIGGVVVVVRGGGTATATIYSNVIYGVGGCQCSVPPGIEVETTGSVSGTANIVNNTVDSTGLSSAGIAISRGYLPTDPSQLTANIFNNIVTHGGGYGITLPAASSQLTLNNGFNDFFDNAQPNLFGGYTPDPSTLSVDPLYLWPFPLIDLSTGTILSPTDHHLKAESPLIDAGQNSPPGGLPTLDADGNPRIAGTKVDFGAYEFGSVPPTTPTPTSAPTTPAAPTATPTATPSAPAATPMPGNTESIMLAGGACNPVTSTYPDSTPAATIAGAVAPSGIAGALWVSQLGVWIGFSPQFPNVSDLAEVDLLQVVFICANGDGAFARPIV